MRNYFLLFLITSLNAYAITDTGNTVMGPATMGQSSYTNSEPLNSHSSEGSKQDDSNSTYMNGNTNPLIIKERGPKGKQAQEEAKERSFRLSPEEVKQKQLGY